MCTGWMCASIPIKQWEITERSCHTLLGWYWLFWLFISLLSVPLLNNTVKKMVPRNKGCLFYLKKYSSRRFEGMDIFCLKFKLVGCPHTFCAKVWRLSHVCTKMQMSCYTDQIRSVSSVYSSKEAESRENSDHTYWELQNGLNIIKRVQREKNSSFETTQRQEWAIRYQIGNQIRQIH